MQENKKSKLGWCLTINLYQNQALILKSFFGTKLNLPAKQSNFAFSMLYIFWKLWFQWLILAIKNIFEHPMRILLRHCNRIEHKFWHHVIHMATMWSDSEVMRRQEGMLVRTKPGYEADTALDRWQSPLRSPPEVTLSHLSNSTHTKTYMCNSLLQIFFIVPIDLPAS